MTQKKTGTGIKAPNKECKDSKCPFHGRVKTRGRIFVGIITAKDTHRTATVVWERIAYVSKYERYLKKKSKVHVHNPPCIDAKQGDLVKITECKPLSKTKKFVIVEKLGRDSLFEQKEEALASSKMKEREKKDKEEKEENNKDNKREDKKKKDNIETKEEKTKEEKAGEEKNKEKDIKGDIKQKDEISKI